jgi:hypothetical protein
LEYNDGTVSDHPGLYVDLDPVSIFGGMTDDPVLASSRGFTSKNEKKTEKYLNELEKYFKDHNICKRINKLVEEAGSITRKQIKRHYEGIDNDVAYKRNVVRGAKSETLSNFSVRLVS